MPFIITIVSSSIIRKLATFSGIEAVGIIDIYCIYRDVARIQVHQRLDKVLVTSSEKVEDLWETNSMNP